MTRKKENCLEIVAYFKNSDLFLTEEKLHSVMTFLYPDPEIISALTKDGSNIADWDKFRTNSIDMPNGQRQQIHFYKNTKTGKIDYETVDFKVKDVITP